MWTRRSMIGALGALAISGPARAAPSEPIKLLNATYEPTHELFDEINPRFSRFYAALSQQQVVVEASEGGSTNQAHAVIDGLLADVAALADTSDISAIERAGLIRPGWRDKLPGNASPYSSTVAFLVRKGNPKGIVTWEDLLRPGIETVTSHPKFSGGGRWSFMSLWAALAGARTYDLGTALGEDEARAAARAARDFPALRDASVRTRVADFYNLHVPALKSGARGATRLFVRDNVGDVLLNWESELRLSIEGAGRDRFDLVYPPSSILGEPPVAVVDAVVDAKGTRAVAEAYLQFLYTSEAQEIFARHHFRPRDPVVLNRHREDLPPLRVFTVEEVFGGWDRAEQTFFADGGIFDMDVKSAQKL